MLFQNVFMVDGDQVVKSIVGFVKIEPVITSMVHVIAHVCLDGQGVNVFKVLCPNST